MRTITTTLLRAFTLSLLFVVGFVVQGLSQTQVTITLENCAATTNSYSFDLVMTNTGTTQVNYGSTTMRFDFSANIMPAGTNTFTSAFVTGSSDFPELNTSIPNAVFTASTRRLQIGTGTGVYTGPVANNLMPSGVKKRVGRFTLTIVTNTNSNPFFVAGQTNTFTPNTTGLVGYESGAPTTSPFTTANAKAVWGTPCTAVIPASCTTPVVVAGTPTNTSCSNLNDGSVTFTVSNFISLTSPTYKINGGASQSLTTGAIALTGLAAGSYSCVVSSGSCSNTAVSATVGTGGNPTTWYADVDQDTYGNASVTQSSCAQPIGYVSNSSDCNDAVASIHPGATEVCNGIDDDCAGGIDNGLTLFTYYRDADGDTYGSASVTTSTCATTAPTGYVNNNNDCNDNDVAVHSLITYYVDADGDTYGGTTTSDQCSATAPTGFSTNNSDCNDGDNSVHALASYFVDFDQDGYGSTVSQSICASSAPVGFSTNSNDCNDLDVEIHASVSYFVDADHDTYGSSTQELVCSATPTLGYSTFSGDCDDAAAAVHPGATEVCNGIDDDCNGAIDNGLTFTTYYVDADGDGFGAGTGSSLCADPGTGYATNGTDCNDGDNSVHALATYYVDADHDGYGSTTTADLCATAAPVGYATNAGDCDDAIQSIHSAITYFADADNDGFGSSSVTTPSCTVAPPSGYVSNSSDCDDANLLYADGDGDGVGAGAPVACGVLSSSDCNDADNTVSAPITYYADADGDGFGNVAAGSAACSSTAPVGYVSNSSDCDDAHTTYADNDNDGFGAGAAVACGVTNDTDCNDGDASVHVALTYYADADHDGFGALNSPTSVCSSTAPVGYVSNSTDCDDAAVLYGDADGDGVGAGSPVACGVASSSDCNDNDNSVSAPQTYYADADGDSFGDAAATTSACSSTAPVGYVSNSSDCDDAHVTYADGDNDGFGFGPAIACGAVTNNADCNDAALLYTDGDNDGFGAGAPVACGVTNNTDCNDNNNAVHATATYYADADGDGFGAGLAAELCAASAPNGYSSNSTDCNDENANIFPGAAEQCNGIDDNCDSYIDNGVTISTFYQDSDGDGVGNSDVHVDACSAPVGYVLTSGDCNDNDNSVQSNQAYFADSDGDGFGDASAPITVCSSTAPSGYVTNSSDCDDAHMTYADGDGDGFGFGPALACGAVTNNSDCNDAATLYADADGDGFGAGAPAACGVASNSDCNDNDNSVHVAQTYYADADGDSYGAGSAVSLCASSAPTGYSANNTDCDDALSSVHPGATEVCNGIDDNCNGSTDEGVQSTFYADADGDGYGNATVTTLACTAPSGYVSNSTDCNDEASAVHPGANEVCNGIDDDCAGGIDNGLTLYTFYADADGDTYGNPLATTSSCATTAPSGYVSDNTDCNDESALAHPGLTEVCGDGLDNNCDGTIDEGCTCTNAPTANAGSNTSVCAGNTVALNGSIGGSATSGTWSSSGDGSFSPSAAVLNAVYTPGANDIASGSVTLTLTTDAVSPCTPASSAITVSITGLPASTGAISGAASFCNPTAPGFSTTFSVAAVQGASTYTWTVPAGVVIISGQGTTSLVVKFNTTAVHNGIVGNVSVQANNSNGCGSSAPSSLTINAQISAPVAPGSISGPDKACAGDIATYSVAAVARAASYTWTLPANASFVGASNGNVVTVAYQAGFSGGVLSVTASNACGTSTPRTRTVTTNILAAPAAISSVSFSGLCGATGVSYTCSTVNGATGYVWTVPAGASITGQSGNSITVDFPSAAFSGSITAAAVNNCGTGAARSVAVTGAPGFPSPISGPMTVCVGAGATYSIPTVAGATSYTWTVTRGFSITAGQGSKIISVQALASGTVSPQTITVKATNACGVSGIRVLDLVAITACPRLGEGAEGINLNVFPNPAHDNMSVYFNSDKDQNATVRMMDATGRVVSADVKAVTAGFNTFEMSVKDFASGIYMLEVNMGGSVQQMRVFVE